MKRPQLLLLIAGIALLGVIYLYPSISNSAEGMTGNLGATFIITYEDDTTKEVNPFTNPLSFLFKGLAVTDTTGKAITEVSWSTYVKADWTGTPSSFKVTGTCKLSVNGVEKRSIPLSASSLSKNTIEGLAGGKITATTLKSYAGSASSATLKIVTVANVEITFTDGTTKNGGATGTATYKYLVTDTLTPTSAITSVSIATYLSPVEDGRVFPVGEN